MSLTDTTFHRATRDRVRRPREPAAGLKWEHSPTIERTCIPAVRESARRDNRNIEDTNVANPPAKNPPATVGANPPAAAPSEPMSIVAGRLLALMSQRTRVEGKWFNGQTVHLDGYHFERCRFDKCTLVYQRADFSISHCVISPDCHIAHGASGSRILRLMAAINPAYQLFFGNMVPSRNLDGTISILVTDPGGQNEQAP